MTHPPSSSRRAIGTPGKADDFAVALSFPRLMQQLQQQHKHYSRLLAQSQRVTELLASQRSEDLPALMEERQKVIDELQRIDKDLAGYRLHWIEWFPRLEKISVRK
ncbi:MAG: flagellar protein FlgN [Phycisphaerales bacterium]|nr:flagellar protein FlgN [Phycisphaerales bacterium]